MVHDFDDVKVNFLYNILAIVKMQDVPDDLILNWNHIAVSIIVEYGLKGGKVDRNDWPR